MRLTSPSPHHRIRRPQPLPSVIGRALEGADVLAERTLEDALERVRASDDIELALIDLCLPGCSRIESVLRFRRAAPGIPLIVISSID